ncbi:MAG: hypothetical protein JWR86_3491 [Enterovirga sp.]|nr:hypothetical protein [Enterovirga sp.]
MAGFGTFCRENLPRDGVMIDVGANIGLTTLTAARYIPGGRILAVEASPRNCTALRDNLARHGVGIATVCACAAGDRAGHVSFFENSAYGHVVTGAGMAAVPSVEQRLATVDDLVAEHGLTRVDLIKIDVEGFEQEVLAGATATLDRFRPAVFLEFNSVCLIASFNRNPRQVLDWLLARFERAYVWRDGRLIDLRAMGEMAFLLEHLARHGGNDDLVLAGPGRELLVRDGGRLPAPTTRLQRVWSRLRGR